MNTLRWNRPRRCRLGLAWLLAFVGATLGLAACAQAPDSAPAAPSRPIERRGPAQGPGATEFPTPVPGSELLTLSTPAQLELLEPRTRDLRDLAARLNPELDEVPLTVAGPPPAWRLGDQERFWVRNTSTNRAVEITATLAYSTPVVYAWVETGQTFDLNAMAASLDRFSALTYPNLVNAFGSEWRPGVDNDGRLHILYNTQMGAMVVGYFVGADEYTRAANPYSNQKEMFYINLALFGDALNRERNVYYHDTTLAHEFQHMIHWHMDRGEDLWVNEGLSEYATEVAEFASDSAGLGLFAAAPDLQLTTWGPSSASNLPYYASSYLFMAYLAQRFGPEAITALVAAPANGMDGVNAALAAVDAPSDAEQIFADWVVANYANQPQALGENGRYGYFNLHLPEFAPAAVHEDAAAGPQQAEVFNFATDYIELSGSSGVSVTLQFAGDAETRLAAADLPAGRAWWSNRGDDAEFRLTRRYDLTALAAGTPLTLTAAMWWEIEHDYDYGYVLASRDGEHWQFLTGSQAATGNPSGNAYGPGYTGVSGGDPAGAPQWVDEQIDLTAYAGGPLWLQFSYITDDAVNLTGWLIDDMQLHGPDGPTAPAAGAADEEAAWQSEGWLLTDNRLPQRWLVQVLEFDGDTLTGVRRVPIDAEGRGRLELGVLGGGRRAVVAVSGLTPVTTLPAGYEYALAPTAADN